MRPAADGLRRGLESFIGRRAQSAVSIVSLSPLPGGTMRHAWAFELDVASGPLAGLHRLIYLEDRGGAPLRSRLSREAEFQVLSVMHGSGVRVPRPYWRIQPGEAADVGPGLIVERVEGETLARRLLQDAAFESVRPRLLEQMGEELARIHAVPTDALECLARPSRGKTPADAQLAEFELALREMGEPHPALELALRWLRGRSPQSERVVVVHGDYRLGNFVVDSEGGLRAVLDWELSHLGDPGEDLGWACMRFWRCVDRPGAPGLGPKERFFDAYAAVNGKRMDPDLALYWEVFGNLRWAIVTLRQAHRHLSGDERSLELASIGRHCAEVEWELLRLLRRL
ncbi:MAG: phosphotransferase family protein [Candidatus Rokubacteria bacterium]|nr:phosphotransferase family protein [Candidatus Rokubacteria bacterium]MBI2555674.1 phosphotransferase family protein [Candidatus Rokubacteria bacterium]